MGFCCVNSITFKVILEIVEHRKFVHAFARDVSVVVALSQNKKIAKFSTVTKKLVFT